MKKNCETGIRLAVCLMFQLVVELGPARDVSITILHTTDVHGHVAGAPARQLPDRPGESDNLGGGGLLRCATVIRGIREQERNVLLIDCGDLIQGTAESFLDKGEVMIEAVRALKYDALIPGNHEFDWGVENLRHLYSLGGIPVLVANCSSAGADGPSFPNAQPFIIREMDGIRVAIVGLNTPHISRWFMPRLLGDLKFEKSVPALRRIMPHVRAQKPHIIILAVHQGYRKWGDDPSNEINGIARSFPELDVIIGGHTHQEVVRRDLHGVPYTQAGCYGLWVGKIQLIVDNTRHSVKDRKFELLRVDESVSPDSELQNQFEETLLDAETYLNQTIGSAESQHLCTSCFPGQSQVQMLIAKAIAEAVGADVVIHRALSASVLGSGRVTMRDVWGIVPYDNYIGIAHLTLSDLRTILEENSKYLDTKEFRGVYGLAYELHPEAPAGSRIRNVRLSDGRLIQGDERVKVALNSYDMASAGDRFPLLREIIEQPLSRLIETRVYTRDAVVKYIKNHSPVNEQAQAGATIVHDRR